MMRWIEWLCGLGAGILGASVVAFGYFGPLLCPVGTQLGASTCVSDVQSSADLARVVPFLVGFGLVFLALILGTTLDSLVRAPNVRVLGRVLLLTGTVWLLIGTGLAILSIGALLLPALLLAFIASTLSLVRLNNRQASEVI